MKALLVAVLSLFLTGASAQDKAPVPEAPPAPAPDLRVPFPFGPLFRKPAPAAKQNHFCDPDAVDGGADVQKCEPVVDCNELLLNTDPYYALCARRI